MGLRAGNLIYACDGVGLKCVEDLTNIIAATTENKTLILHVRREGNGAVRVKFPERPHPPIQR